MSDDDLLSNRIRSLPFNIKSECWSLKGLMALIQVTKYGNAH